MSYWVYLYTEEEELVEVTSHEEGGTRVVGGSTRAQLNVTYNYSDLYHEHDFSIKDLHRQTAGSTILKLTLIVDKLGVEQSDDYWEPTPGNAGHALNVLLGWARQYPDAIWEVH